MSRRVRGTPSQGLAVASLLTLLAMTTTQSVTL